MPGLLHTFGGSKAAETLVHKLANDRKAIARVSRFYCDYNKTLNTFEMLIVSDGHFWKNLLRIYIEDRMSRLPHLISEEQGQTYLKNIMTVKKRHIIRMLEDIIKIERMAHR